MPRPMLPVIVGLGLAGAVGMAVGALAPWVEFFGTDTADGFDANGEAVLLAAGIAAFGIALAVIRPGLTGPAWAACAAGLVTLVLAADMYFYFDASEPSGLVDPSGVEAPISEPRWGIYLTVASSLVVVLASAALALAAATDALRRST